MAAHCWLAGWDSFKNMYMILIMYGKKTFLGRIGLYCWGFGEKLNYFWSQGVIMIDYLEQGRTINGACYAGKLRKEARKTDSLAVVRPTGVYLLVSFAPVFSFIYCWVLIFCVISFLYLDFICSRRLCIDKLGVCHANQTSMCLDPHLN